MTVTRSGTDGAATPATSPATAPPPAPGTPSSLATRLGSLVSSIRSGFEGTPGRMRAVAAVTVLAAVVFGLLAGYSFRAADGALARAKANTDQLIRVQAIQNHVVQADADATNAFLVGGLEPAAQRADYTDCHLLGVPADRRGRQEPACRRGGAGRTERGARRVREHDRAGAGEQPPGTADRLPVPQGRQRRAARQALPPLKNLVDANNARAAEEFDNAGKAAVWLVVAGLLTLLVLGLGMFWLARRTRRYLNVPLAAAAAIVFVALVRGCHRPVRRRQQGRHRAGRCLRRHPVHGAGAHRRLRRQVQREPDADRPRLGCGLRDRLEGRGRGRPASDPRPRTEPGGRRPRHVAVGPVRDRARKRSGSSTTVGDWDGAVAWPRPRRPAPATSRSRSSTTARGRSCRRSARTRHPISTRPVAGCPSPLSWASSQGSWPPSSPGGASRSGWRSTDDPPPRRSGRPGHGGDALAGRRLLVRGRLRRPRQSRRRARHPRPPRAAPRLPRPPLAPTSRPPTACGPTPPTTPSRLPGRCRPGRT